jgi:hypothetical protein
MNLMVYIVGLLAIMGTWLLRMIGMVVCPCILVYAIGKGIHMTYGPTGLAWYVIVLIIATLITSGLITHSDNNYYTKKDLNNRNNNINTYNSGTPTVPIRTGGLKKIVRTMTKSSSFLLDGEREKPPRAQFFGRLDGEMIDKEGKLEEKWLGYYEFMHWEKQKEREAALQAGILDETDEEPIPTHYNATKSVYTT